MARTWREQRRIEEKIGEDWQRPKGMGQRTYERLMDRLTDCELRRDEAFCVAAARLLGSMRNVCFAAEADPREITQLGVFQARRRQ